MRPTFAEALSGRDNALNAVRLVLALLVVLSHAWPLGGYGVSELEVIGDVALSGFFAMSGYLVAASRERTPFVSFLTRRALRILPGFWVCLLLIALVFSSVAGWLNGRGWDAGAAWDYVTGNAALLVREDTIGPTLSQTHANGRWNGPLWTLFYEASAYILCGLLLTAAWARRHLVAVSAALVLVLPALTAQAAGLPGGEGKMALSAVRLFAPFAAGMLIYALRDRMRPHAGAALGCLAVIAALCVAGEAWVATIGPAPIAYLVLATGALWRTRIAARDDVSYGVYIYHWPMQQLLTLAGLDALTSVWGFGLVSVLATLPLAWLSWRVVERPALRLAQRITASPPTSRRPRRERVLVSG